MNKVLINWLIFTVLCLTWGSSFILMKRGLDVFTSGEVAALRIFIASLSIIPLSVSKIKKRHLHYWPYFLGMGLCGNFIPAFLFTRAETSISSSLAGMLNSLTPFFTLLIGAAFFHLKVNRPSVIGIVVGLIGAVGLLFTVSGENAFTGSITGCLLIILATAGYGTSANIVRRFLHGVDATTCAAWALGFIGPVAAIYLFGFTNFTQKLSSHPKAFISLGYVSILAVFGTTIALILYNQLIKNTSALFASSVAYAMPIVAIFWALLAGESVQLSQVIWMLVILAGVYIVNKYR